jgi:selenium metabolism protein YedF
VKEDHYWKVKILKGYPCEVAAPEVNNEPEKELFLVVATDIMGKEKELGKTLMKGFFETMKVYREVPNTIFFLNTGVRLTTTSVEMIGLLRELDAMGVMIFTCGTCLKHFNLESELKVGYRGTTTNILEGMKDCRKTVWIG